MENTTPSSRVGLKGVVTLLIVIVLGSLGFAYWLYSQNEALKKSNNELQAKYSSSDSLLSQITDEQKIISDTSAVVVNLAGTKAAPHAKASVYWDSTAASVYLVVKNMPELPSDNQYQLWALIDGKPANLGVFDTPKNKVLLKMQNNQKADAFAITIEKKGGSASPTLEKMQSYGKRGI